MVAAVAAAAAVRARPGPAQELLPIPQPRSSATGFGRQGRPLLLCCTFLKGHAPAWRERTPTGSYRGCPGRRLEPERREGGGLLPPTRAVTVAGPDDCLPALRPGTPLFYTAFHSRLSGAAIFIFFSYFPPAAGSPAGCSAPLQPRALWHTIPSHLLQPHWDWGYPPATRIILTVRDFSPCDGEDMS